MGIFPYDVFPQEFSNQISRNPVIRNLQNFLAFILQQSILHGTHWNRSVSCDWICFFWEMAAVYQISLGFCMELFSIE
jgi:hypothetical protein